MVRQEEGIDFPPNRPCLGSGMCCRVPCGYGEWNETKTQCRHLEVKLKVGDITTYKCGIYDYIIKQPGADYYPAFGAGCCQPIGNTERTRILGLIREGLIELPHPINHAATERNDQQ